MSGSEKWMKAKLATIVSMAISILLTSILPNLLTNMVPIPYAVLAITICVFLIIIFSLVQTNILNKTMSPLEEKVEILQKKVEALQKEKESLKQSNKKTQQALLEKEKIIKKYTVDSFAATGIVFNQDFSKVLLAYHEKQKRWIPPGSHVEGVKYFHEVVIDSAKKETGYDVRFHQSHDYEKYSDANCCVVPCPFSVQVETQIEGEGHQTHYDALYILVADENQEILKPGTHKIKWLPINKLRSYARRNDTYPDVVQSVQEALKFIESKKGETQDENK